MDCLHRQDSTFDWRNESARLQLGVPDSLKKQCTTAVAGALYSNKQLPSHILDQYHQTQIRFTGFPILT